jgi:hypothetical protein
MKGCDLMTTADQLTRTGASTNEARDLTIHVAGRGLFLVMRGGHELLRGTFQQCYDYINAAQQGLTC